MTVNVGCTLITGSTGMLGRYVMDLLRTSDGREVRAVSKEDCDLINPAAAYDLVKQVRPSAILHLAAETDVDLCERDPERAGLINHLATASIARAASEIGAWVLYVSTSNVFGAEGKLLYNELDSPSPTNYYGRSKLMGENAIRQRLPDMHFVVRAGWMIGGGPQYDHKFVGKLIAQIKNGASELRAVTDKFGTLTSARLLAELIVSAWRKQSTGTFHFGSTGVTTRFDIAQATAEVLSFKGKLTGVQSSIFPLSAPRPQSEGIESIYTKISGVIPHSWRSDLEAYLAEFD